MSTFNYELAATVLVEAAYKGDKAAAAQWGLSVRSIQNYRARLLEDEKLVALFTHKKDLAEKDWAADAPMAIKAALNFLLRAAQDGITVSSETVHAIAGAMKLVADVALTKQVLDARLADTNRPANGQHHKVAAGDISAN